MKEQKYKNHKISMTEGNISIQLLKFSIPLLMGNIVQQFYSMVDSIIVGNLIGSDALAAVGATGSLIFLFFSLCTGMASGVGIMIAQYDGAKDLKSVKKTIANSIYIIGATAIIMGLVGMIFSPNVLKLLRTPSNIYEDALIYMKIICGGTIAVGVYNAIAAILRALGDTKTPLYFLILSSILNIGLDLLFVITIPLGVAGVAYATIISQGLSAIACIIYSVIKIPEFSLTKQDYKICKDTCYQIFRLGTLAAFQHSLLAISHIIIQRVVNGFGSAIVAAFTVTSKLEQLVMQPYNSLGIAMSTFAGQNMGAGNIQRIKEGHKKSLKIIIVISIVLSLTMFFGAETFVKFFVKDFFVIQTAAKATKIISIFFFPLGAIFVIRGLLTGAGDAVYGMINGLAEMLARICFAVPLTSISFIGVWGIWLTTGITWIITSLASEVRYRRGKWIEKGIVKKK